MRTLFFLKVHIAPLLCQVEHCIIYSYTIYTYTRIFCGRVKYNSYKIMCDGLNGSQYSADVWQGSITHRGLTDDGLTLKRYLWLYYNTRGRNKMKSTSSLNYAHTRIVGLLFRLCDKNAAYALYLITFL